MYGDIRSLKDHGWITDNRKTRACIGNPAHHALHEFDQATRNLYGPKPNGWGGMTRPSTRPVGFKVNAAVASVVINVNVICPLSKPSFPLRTHELDLTRNNHIEWVGKYDLQTRSPGQIQRVVDTPWPTTWWSLYRRTQDRRGSGSSSGHQTSFPEWWEKLLLLVQRNISTIYTVEATDIILALDYYRHVGPVRYDIVVYIDLISCYNDWRGIYWEASYLLTNPLWLLGNKGKHVRLCWITSHSVVIEGNGCVDQLAKESLAMVLTHWQEFIMQIESH